MRFRLIASLAVALLMFFAPAAQASEHTGTVTVLHGVLDPPDLVVDVYVNGDLTIPDFEPRSITDPLDLPAGTYDIEIFAAGADPNADDPLITGSADLAAGDDVSIIAHVDADGAPTLSVFANDVSTVAAGEARVTIRHTAAAPAVDILVDGEPTFTDLVNGDEIVADLPAGTYEAAVALAGQTEPVIGPVDVDLDEGTNTIVYAIGPDENGDYDALFEIIEGLHEAPDKVDSGLGGLKAAEQQHAVQLSWVIALASVALLGAVVRLVGLSRR